MSNVVSCVGMMLYYLGKIREASPFLDSQVNPIRNKILVYTRDVIMSTTRLNGLGFTQWDTKLPIHILLLGHVNKCGTVVTVAKM